MDKKKVLLYWEDYKYRDYTSVSHRKSVIDIDDIGFYLFDNRDLPEKKTNFTISNLEGIGSLRNIQRETLKEAQNFVDQELKNQGYILLTKEQSEKYKILI